eukprot:12052249-Alexandrium_andersonii.AAC.1
MAGSSATNAAPYLRPPPILRRANSMVRGPFQATPAQALPEFGDRQTGQPMPFRRWQSAGAQLLG